MVKSHGHRRQQPRRVPLVPRTPHPCPRPRAEIGAIVHWGPYVRICPHSPGRTEASPEPLRHRYPLVPIHIGWIGPMVGCAVHKGASLSSIFRSRVCCEYGGYLTPGSIRVLWYRTPRALVNASKLTLPWYLPIPELPTPPKGSSGKNGWIVHSLMHAVPDSVASKMRSATLRSSANTYVPSGGGWLLIDWMTFSIESAFDHRQDRTKHFLLQDRRVGRGIHQNRRRNIEFIGVSLPADDHF